MIGIVIKIKGAKLYANPMKICLKYASPSLMVAIK
jgi:hypothetical protein